MDLDGHICRTLEPSVEGREGDSLERDFEVEFGPKTGIVYDDFTPPFAHIAQPFSG